MYDFGGASGKLFGDVNTLSEPQSLDYSTKVDGELSNVPAFTCAVGGFPCKDRTRGPSWLQLSGPVSRILAATRPYSLPTVRLLGRKPKSASEPP